MSVLFREKKKKTLAYNTLNLVMYAPGIKENPKFCEAPHGKNKENNTSIIHIYFKKGGKCH